jgi:hypothetical protein
VFGQKEPVRERDSNAAECRQLGERASISFELLLETIHSEAADSSWPGNTDVLMLMSARLNLQTTLPLIALRYESGSVAFRAG